MMVPIPTCSRRSGTNVIERKPVTACTRFDISGVSGDVVSSSSMILRSTIARADGEVIGSKGMGYTVLALSTMNLASPSLADAEASKWNMPFLRIEILADHGSKRFAALRTIDSNTGLASVGERLMTFNTSLVAVWYSNTSCSSHVRACISLKALRGKVWVALGIDASESPIIAGF